MPVTCIMMGCVSRANRDKVHFFCVPDIVNSKYFPHLNNLSRERRQKWISAIKRGDLTPSKLRNQRVCSRHFLTGKPSKLEDVNNPDWVPSQHLGHISQATCKRKYAKKRKMELDKRRLAVSKQDEEKIQLELTDVDFANAEEPDGCASQTDLTMDMSTLKYQQLNYATVKISNLEEKFEKSPLGLLDDTTNDEKWKFYTGFEHKRIQLIFEDVEQYIPTTSTTELSSFNQLLLTLIKLRLDLHFIDLAYRFQISPLIASTYFLNIIEILYQRLKSLIIWPDGSAYRKNIPTCFKEAFHEKTSIIIDCFEIFIEKPVKFLTQQQCWSNDKHHYTVKFLIGITPQGTICYISKAWGGQTSDKQMVELSNFCDNIKPGDVVLADKGFLIEETLGVSGVKLVIPAFTKGENQLHPIEIEEASHIAHVRIHIERIIGVIKNKFKLLKGPIPVSMLNKGNNEEANVLDKIFTTCSALMNLVNPIVPI